MVMVVMPVVMMVMVIVPIVMMVMVIVVVMMMVKKANWRWLDGWCSSFTS